MLNVDCQRRGVHKQKRKSERLPPAPSTHSEPEPPEPTEPNRTPPSWSGWGSDGMAGSTGGGWLLPLWVGGCLLAATVHILMFWCVFFQKPQLVLKDPFYFPCCFKDWVICHKMLRSDSDSTSCVASILDSFKRKASPNRLEIDEVNRPGSAVATRLNFANESLERANDEHAKRTKWSFDGTPSASNTSQLDVSAVGMALNSVFLFIAVNTMLPYEYIFSLLRITMGSSSS